jgi:predicted N-acetyltransferase YhbS
MEVRSAHRSERDEVLELLGHWYNDGGEFFARYNHNDPGFRDALCLVARDGGRLVSTVQIFDRAINLDGQSVPMGGIGSVFTLDEYRHQRVASALMRLSVDTMIRKSRRRADLGTSRFAIALSSSQNFHKQDPSA